MGDKLWVYSTVFFRQNGEEHFLQNYIL